MPILSGGSGSAQTRTATATVTTDPSTFTVASAFDLGTAGPHIVQCTATGLVLTGDGETFGNIAGTIYAQPAPASSTTSGAYIELSAASTVLSGTPATVTFEVQSVALPTAQVWLAARYLQVTTTIQSNDTGVIYAGPNHPTAQIRLDLIYL